MRRLAKQSRDDEYASRRDYQQVGTERGCRLRSEERISELRWTASLPKERTSHLIGAGGFVSTATGTGGALRLEVDGVVVANTEIRFGTTWKRIGRAIELLDGSVVTAIISFAEAQEYVDIWGLAAGAVEFPNRELGEHPPVDELNVVHLMPESLHLHHSRDLPSALQGFSKVGDGPPIELKKCSYCGRRLPVGPGVPGGQSFHKHNAKLSGHQNECRSCKKWKINDHFNPRRTVDQFNESGIIARERRILAREAEIMQRIKEREGRGLKSIIWDRFDRACFYCGKKLTLNEMQLDHTRPLSYLWPIDEHATCLCGEHNNHKKDRFPVDFYSEKQLRRLADLTGLSFEKLSERSVCEPELARIRADIVGYARSIEPRTFNAIARKVAELKPDVDLWKELADADRITALRIRRYADSRPEPIAAE